MSYFYGETDNAQAVASDDSSIAAINSNVNSSEIDLLKKLLEKKENLLNEKERTIQILMKK